VWLRCTRRPASNSRWCNAARLCATNPLSCSASEGRRELHTCHAELAGATPQRQGRRASPGWHCPSLRSLCSPQLIPSCTTLFKTMSQRHELCLSARSLVEHCNVHCAPATHPPEPRSKHLGEQHNTTMACSIIYYMTMQRLEPAPLPCAWGAFRRGTTLAIMPPLLCDTLSQVCKVPRPALMVQTPPRQCWMRMIMASTPSTGHLSHTAMHAPHAGSADPITAPHAGAGLHTPGCCIAAAHTPSWSGKGP
jgi:hypothetical protein